MSTVEVMAFDWTTGGWEKTSMPETEYWERRELETNEVLTLDEYFNLEELLEPFEAATWEQMAEQGGEPAPGSIADLSFTGVPMTHKKGG